jgi:hypothetical protein
LAGTVGADLERGGGLSLDRNQGVHRAVEENRDFERLFLRASRGGKEDGERRGVGGRGGIRAGDEDAEGGVGGVGRRETAWQRDAEDEPRWQMAKAHGSPRKRD